MVGNAEFHASRPCAEENTEHALLARLFLPKSCALLKTRVTAAAAADPTE